MFYHQIFLRSLRGLQNNLALPHNKGNESKRALPIVTAWLNNSWMITIEAASSVALGSNRLRRSCECRHIIQIEPSVKALRFGVLGNKITAAVRNLAPEHARNQALPF